MSHRRHKKPTKWFPEHPCKNPKCDKMIPIPMVFCSSVCWRECNEVSQQVKKIKRVRVVRNKTTQMEL